MSGASLPAINVASLSKYPWLACHVFLNVTLGCFFVYSASAWSVSLARASPPHQKKLSSTGSVDSGAGPELPLPLSPQAARVAARGTAMAPPPSIRSALRRLIGECEGEPEGIGVSLLGVGS